VRLVGLLGGKAAAGPAAFEQAARGLVYPDAQQQWGLAVDRVLCYEAVNAMVEHRRAERTATAPATAAGPSTAGQEADAGAWLSCLSTLCMHAMHG
jgi:hypothetical protein